MLERMVNCWPRTPLAIAGTALWLVAGVACFEVGRRLSWENIGPQAARVQARDALLLRQLEFRRSGDLHLTAVSNKRTVFLVNTFVINTARLLNNFSAICEQALSDVHHHFPSSDVWLEKGGIVTGWVFEIVRRIVRLETTTVLLESKLRSVTELQGAENNIPPPNNLTDISLPSGVHLSTSDPIEAESSSSVRRSGAEPSLVELPDRDEERPESSSSVHVQPEHLKMQNDPIYSRFFRMLRVGVPVSAVRLQLSIEGLDPSILDSYEALSPHLPS